MIEILIFFVAALGAVFISGYAVHMFVGGLVSTETEHQLIALVCGLVVCAIAFMAWDVVQRRKKAK
jgi:hypothetical protein